jgi:two-component system cell cycle response regulator DivK
MTGPGTGKTILIAEDNDDSRTIYREYLEHAGYRVVEATNGEDALALARSEPPDIILMDVSMPKMDGLTATRILKADARLRSVPVVALTAHAMASDAEMARAAGCDGYLAKPIAPREVCDEVEQRIGPARSA